MLRRKKSEKRLRERIDSLLPDSEILVAETSPPSAPASPQSSPNLLTLRDSVLRVVGVIDQLLTIETLIYFAQSLIELFVLSFQFAYQQPSVAAHQFSIPTRLRQSFRRNKSTIQHSQRSPGSAERVPSRPLSSPLSYLSAPVFTKTPVDRASQTSGTGSRCFSPRQPPRHVPPPINPARFPPPPSVPKLPPSFQLAPIAAQSLPAQAPVIVDQPTAPVSEQTPSSRSASKSPPRRKPVASGHVRKSSAKFNRPVTNSSDPSVVSASTPPRGTTQSPAGQHQLPGPAVDVSLPKVTIEPAAIPRLVRKSSAKLIRPPPDAAKLDPASEPSSIILSEAEQPSKKKAPKKSNRDSPTNRKPLVRKSSAKFIRPPIAPQPTPAKVDRHSNQEPTSKSSSIEAGKVEHHTPAQAPQLTPDTPKFLDRTAGVLHNEQPKQPQSDEEFVPELPQHGTSSVTLVEPIPQKLTPRSNLSLFPPRPAIAVLHPQVEAVDSPTADITSAFSSFPELPPLVLSFSRQPPPPPSIPRFPSPTKASELATSPPVRSDSVNSSIERPPSSLIQDPMEDDQFPAETSLLPDIHPTSPLPEDSSPSRPSEPPPASLRSDGPALLTLHSSTGEIPQTLPPAVFPREWDPSEEEIAFEQQTQNVSKTVIATTPERRFSFHGSIESDSPPRDSSPPPEPEDRLSSSHLSDRARHSRAVSTNSQYIPSPLPSPRTRPHSAGSVSSGSEYVPPQFLFDNTHLKPGNAAALLSHAETLNLYRQNAKKAVDNPAIQYEFAIFMMDAARESTLDLNSLSPTQRDELTKEALSILRRLADRGYPQAQYYLADCYTNGIGCKHNNSDLEKAFPLFVLAAKHGHVEASFRAALAYENAWGCRRDPLKALQFYRKAASGNHPGAMLRLGKACLGSEFGMPSTQLVTVEGVNWLKRAVEAATPLYPNAPYELALLHEYGYKDVVFPDEAYSMQLFAKAADLGHAEAAYRLGEAYEYGRMGCPEDPALSVHYYSLSARGANPAAMLSLCAWYLMGADGVFEKSEDEAFAWAHRAAELGLAKAEFATGYFLERGVGCRRDGLEAWKYYVRAADHGDERAVARLRAGKEVNADRGTLAGAVAAETSRWSGSEGEAGGGKRSPQKVRLDLDESPKPTKEKDCIVM